MRITAEQRDEILSRWNCDDIKTKKLLEQVLEEATSPEPLAIIVIEDINEVPQIIYRGEELKHKVLIGYTWGTDNEMGKGPRALIIEHFNEREMVKIVESGDK